MIGNNALSDRLNSFKNSKDSSDDKEQKPGQPLSPALGTLAVTCVVLLFFVLKIAAYGYGLRTVLSADWSFLETAGVGSMLYFVLEYVHGLIHFTHKPS